MRFTIGGESYEMKMDSWQRSNVSPSIELTVERKMTDIEQKALALWNEVRVEREYTYKQTSINRETDMAEALCRAIEQHEAFRQEVSDAVVEYFGPKDLDVILAGHFLERFIIPAPKPDPLEDILNDTFGYASPVRADRLRGALDALGFEIREKGQ